MATKKKPAKKTTSKKTLAKRAAKKAPVKKVAKKKATTKTAAKKKATKKTTRKTPAMAKGAIKLSKARSKANLNQLIGRAITDQRFRAQVIKDPQKALAQYPMLPGERDAVLQAARSPLAAAQSIDKMIADTIGPVGAI